MDSDSDPRAIAQGNYIYALNLFNGSKAQPGTMINDKGTVQSFYTPPAGTNTWIGAAEDKQNRTIVGFLHNSNGNHRVVRYYPNDNLSEEVAAGSWLGFSLSRRIHSAHIIDGKFLTWTDGRSDDNAISGEEPRMLDMDRASLNKALAYDLNAGIQGNGQFQTGATYEFEVSDDSGVLESATFVADGTYADDPTAGLQWLAEEIQASDLASYIEVEVCDCKLKLKMIDRGYHITFSSSDPQTILVNANFIVYPISAMEPYHAALKRETADCAPMPQYVALPNITRNNVRDGCFQFRSRFIYADGQASHWSAVSVTPLNNAELGPPQESLNCIRLDFTDDRLNDTTWLAIIKYVELSFRDGNNDEFKLIKRIPICEIGSVSQVFDFLNDDLYNVVPSDDLSVGDASVQILTNFHNVPRVSGSLSPIAGTDGHVRIQHSATLEGYECPDCVEAKVLATTETSGDLVDIRGTVEIINDPRAFDTDMRYPNYELGGFVVYLAGTNHFAISDNPLDGTGSGEFVIAGVPRGVYSLRVASFMCRYDDSLGPRYNLNNGLVWQRTSSPVVDCCGAIADNGFQHERTINLYGFSGPVFDLDTEPFFGTLKIQNCHHAPATPGNGTINLVESYCLDNEGLYEELDNRLGATSVERRLVQFRVGSSSGFLPSGDATFPSPTAETDHNGYAFASIRMDVANGVDRIRLVVPEWGGDDSTSPQPYPVFAADTPDYLNMEDGWDMITQNTAIDYRNFLGDASNTVLIQSDLSAWTVFAFQADPAWSKANRAKIAGKCVDANGVGLAGVLVWMVTNGRYESTNFAGEFVLATYGDGGGARSALQVLYPTYPPDVPGLFPPAPSNDDDSFALDADADGVADTHTTADFEFGFAGGILFDKRFLKSGGVYKYGIVYEDEFGRSCGVSPIGTLDVPFHTSDGQYVPRAATFEIHSLPPVWAKKYRIVRTRDTFYLTYKHSPVGRVLYAVIPDGVTDPVFTAYSANNATHIMLSVPSTAQDVTVPAGTVLVMFNDQRATGYRSKKGDRVRYMLDEAQQTVFDGSVLEVTVEGEYIEGNEYFVVIPYTEIFREVKKGWTFEFFTPKGFEEEIYYETGVCLPIGIFGEPNRYHTGITQDQNPLTDPPLPATGPVLSGDTYWWREQFVFSSDFGAQLVAEHWRRSKYSADKCEDIGRPFLYDPNAGEFFYHNRIRFSGPFAALTQVNDLNAYGALDFQSINRTYGPIKWSAMVHSVLLCICQNKVQPVYVGKGDVIDLTGSSFVGRSDRILNVGPETASNAGTLNPESVVNEGGRVWWWDMQNAKVWQYAGNGVQDINFGKNRYFRDKSIERFKVPRASDIVVGGFDRKHDLYLLSYGPGSYVIEGITYQLAQDTLGYDVEAGGWRSHFSFFPDCMCAHNSDLMLFKNGAMWTMFKGFYNNFFNLPYVSKVKFAVNEDPHTDKDWFCVRIQSKRQFYAPEILTLPGTEVGAGMASVLKPVNLVLKANHWFADFLRDMNDPHAEFASISPDSLRRATAALRGRHLKGEVLVITLETSNGQQDHVLWAVQTDWSDAQTTP